MEQLGKILIGLSGFAWPSLVVFVGWRFRGQLSSVFQLLKQQLASGAAFKWRDFEFKGLDLASFDSRDGSGYRQEIVDEQVFQRRHSSYKCNKNLFFWFTGYAQLGSFILSRNSQPSMFQCI